MPRFRHLGARSQKTRRYPRPTAGTLRHTCRLVLSGGIPSPLPQSRLFSSRHLVNSLIMTIAGMAPNASAIPIPLQISDAVADVVLVHLPGLPDDVGSGPGVGKIHPRPFSFIVGNSGQRASSARRLRRDHVLRTPRVVWIPHDGHHPISPPHAVNFFGTNQATPCGVAATCC